MADKLTKKEWLKKIKYKSNDYIAKLLVIDEDGFDILSTEFFHYLYAYYGVDPEIDNALLKYVYFVLSLKKKRFITKSIKL